MLKLDLDLEEADRETRWRYTLTLLRCLAYRDAKVYITRRGIHVRIPSLPPTFTLRRMFNDDIARVEMDEERAKRGAKCNVLFNEKDNMWEVEVSLEEALDYVSGGCI
jgi:hypothetical protein